MAVEYVNITDLSEWVGSELGGNEPIQVSATAFTTIGAIADFIQSKYPTPKMLEIPWDIINLETTSPSNTITKAISKMATDWSDFVSKIRSAQFMFTRNPNTIIDNYVCQIDCVVEQRTNSVSFYYQLNNINYFLNIQRMALNPVMYGCIKTQFKKPVTSWTYLNGQSNIGTISAGNNIMVISPPSSKITAEIDASTFIYPNNTVARICVPGPTTKVNLTLDNGIPVLYSDMAWEPSDLGGGTQDRILYTLTAMSTNNNPSPSGAEIWMFADAQIFKIRG